MEYFWNILFQRVENVRDLLFHLMKHGTNTLHVALIFLFSILLQVLVFPFMFCGWTLARILR